MYHARLMTLLVLLVAVGGATTGGAGMAPGSDPSDAAPAQGTLPAHCQLERNLGACVTCCMEAGWPGNLCAMMCRVPPPPTEPEP